MVSDLSGAWNPPELWPQSRAKADLGNAPKHQGFKSTQPSRACCRWASQDPPASKLAAGDRWQGAGLVFCTSVGTAVDAANVRRSFRRWPRPLAWTRRAPKRSENELSLQEGFRLLSSYPDMSAGGSPPHEDEDAHGDQGIQYRAPLGQRG